MRGDYQSATDTLVTLFQRIGIEGNIVKNLCYFHLADIEVEIYSPEREDLSESWLNRFETHVEGKGYPGFAAQAKILRTKLLQKKGESEKSQALANEVLEIAKSPSMRYLKEMIVTYVPEISSWLRIK